MLSISPRQLPAFLFRFSALYVVVLVVALWLPLARALLRIETDAARTVVHHAADWSVPPNIREDAGNILVYDSAVNLDVRWPGNNFVYGLLVFIALAASTAGFWSASGLRLMLVGCGAIVGINVLAMAALITSDLRARGTYHQYLMVVLWTTGTGPMTLVMIVYACCAAKLFRRAPAAMGARRNDPCPCGSGAKFKRCCGST